MTKSEQGDFYVESTECVTCGCCQSEAPSLFKYESSNGPSIVLKQPETDDEFSKMFSAISICMVDCIYYRGSDNNLKAKRESLVGYPSNCSSKKPKSF